MGSEMSRISPFPRRLCASEGGEDAEAPPGLCYRPLEPNCSHAVPVDNSRELRVDALYIEGGGQNILLVAIKDLKISTEGWLHPI